MAKITKFDRTNLKSIRKDIDAALTAALAKHGLTAELGNIRFSTTDFRCKLNVEVGSKAGPAASVTDTTSANERKFKAHAWKFGLSGDEFGKTFRQRGTAFTIVEINPRAKVGGYPIIARNARGTEYKFPAERAMEAV